MTFPNFPINVTVKAKAEKAWLLYEFPFSVNPSDILNVMHRHERAIHHYIQ